MKNSPSSDRVPEEPPPQKQATEPTPMSITELEWLFCLASTLQAVQAELSSKEDSGETLN
jgi:hypothetical protein